MNAEGWSGGSDRIERMFYTLKADEWGVSFEQAKELIETAMKAMFEKIRELR